MNNKVLARVVAALVAVMMLGTMCFAAGSVDVSTETAPTNSTKTVLAVAATGNTMPEITNANIMYVDQIESGTYPGAITYDEDRLPDDATHMIVRFGGDTGNYVDVPVALSEGTPSVHWDGLDVVYEIEIGGKKYTNVVASTYEIPLVEGKKIGTFGVAYSKWGETKPTSQTDLSNAELRQDVPESEPATKVGIANFTGDTEKFSKLTGPGTVCYKTVIVNASGVSGVEAFGYATYVDVPAES